MKRIKRTLPEMIFGIVSFFVIMVKYLRKRLEKIDEQ